ncbi:hypothetical protein AVEN_1727-1 [Araneus ventricosus]|uniref:Uncharacterized protein n=1 Tax=Araneus ventricosus TaxID=182803 RepID=A0A4Y2N1Z0_ARAVE|nr:hypothetical protein AVEN_1727-1 [Araneus ventricosus]
MGRFSASHRWYAPSDGTYQCEPPVVRAASWDISVRATGGTRSLMGHISAATRGTRSLMGHISAATRGTRSLMGRISVSHRWYAPPDGTYQCEPLLVRAA